MTFHHSASHLSCDAKPLFRQRDGYETSLTGYVRCISRLLKYLQQQVFSSLIIQSWHAAMDGRVGEASASAIDLP
jgi:hypothetical protein